LNHYCHDIEIYREYYSVEKVESLLPGNNTGSVSLEDWSESVANLSVSILLDMENEGDYFKANNIPYSTESGVLSKQLWRLVSRLNEMDEEVILYHYLYEYSFEEMADIFCVSKSTVFKRHKKAMSALRIVYSKKDTMLVA